MKGSAFKHPQHQAYQPYKNYGYKDTSLSLEEDFETENIPIAQSCKNSIADIDKIYSQLFEKE